MWHFSSCESIRKIEKIQKRCHRIILNDYENDYETLLCNSNKPTVETRRLRTLSVETFKTLNEINPPYIKNIIMPKEKEKVRQNEIIIKRINTSRFSTQSLRFSGPKIWNNLSSTIKSEISFPKIKGYFQTVHKKGMHRHVSRKCSAVWYIYIYIYKFIKCLHIYIYIHIYI